MDTSMGAGNAGNTSWEEGFRGPSELEGNTCWKTVWQTGVQDLTGTQAQAATC